MVEACAVGLHPEHAGDETVRRVSPRAHGPPVLYGHPWSPIAPFRTDVAGHLGETRATRGDVPAWQGTISAHIVVISDHGTL